MGSKDFFRFERPNDDFPYYDEEPSLIRLPQGIFLVVALIVSFLIFSHVAFIPDFLRPFINLIIPLLALMVVVGPKWKWLFRRVVPKDILPALLALK
ncbi:hypothetical protein BAMA_20880 [Bacillus manliponensis]|uniref:Uncharacterized protein n=1 Tax=Bacillus manliponensis TaxID=574376 RepID=A0A073KBL9_9BACI|nr:hypothetical protein [Bacillus manliponensis]KEK19703.1 hypothetical protein BAMA_20880 [Bacillus manliponensis]